MKLTNRNNLPAPIVEAVKNSTYNKGHADISVSELWSPPQIKHLTRTHNDDLEVDVVDQIWTLLGDCVHVILERAAINLPDRITEERFFVEHEGKIIGGKPDTLALSESVLQDWKVTSTWTILRDSRKEEWINQLNTYAWMLRRLPEPIEVKRLQIVAILRDWSKLEAKRNPAYPIDQEVTIDIPLLPDEEMTRKISERLHLHFDWVDNPPPCTPEDTWEKPPIFAVMKPGQQRALRLCDTREEAEAWISMKGKPREQLYVEDRPTKRIRCESYCAAARFCPQYAAFLSSSPQPPKASTDGML